MDESGQQKDVGTDHEGQEVRGSYSYTGPDGVVYTMNYISNENGFQPQGDHLPTPPPIPEAILKALELNAAEEAAGKYDDGSYKARDIPSKFYQTPKQNIPDKNGYKY